ncbi:hypothetical protein ACQEUU_07735 [Nonomuraea sp. CA-218870]|uniref:hypothetical protein n=1 Tax=Nonomuraea sp. CA-218870 TaxID=3239998 RepID=UPI003D90B857
MAERILEVHIGAGLDDLRFDMDEAQVRAGLATYGNVVDATAPGGALCLRTEGIDETFSVYAAFKAATGTLYTLEIWRPSNIRLIDVDVFGTLLFATPATQILDRITELGHRVDAEDQWHPILPDASIGLDREGGDDCDDDGLARYFQSIFIAPPGYYARPGCG